MTSTVLGYETRRSTKGTCMRSSAVAQDQHRREHGHRREPRQDDRGARDEAELAHAAEIGQPQDVEGAPRGDRAEQHSRATPGGRDLDRLLEVPSEEELLFIAEKKVDSVVDPD